MYICKEEERQRKKKERESVACVMWHIQDSQGKIITQQNRVARPPRRIPWSIYCWVIHEIPLQTVQGRGGTGSSMGRTYLARA